MAGLVEAGPDEAGRTIADEIEKIGSLWRCEELEAGSVTEGELLTGGDDLGSLDCELVQFPSQAWNAAVGDT